MPDISSLGTVVVVVVVVRRRRCGKGTVDAGCVGIIVIVHGVPFVVWRIGSTADIGIAGITRKDSSFRLLFATFKSRGGG
eukprot:scaffold69322_cov106-Attheya_sp.AAC.2